MAEPHEEMRALKLRLLDALEAARIAEAEVTRLCGQPDLAEPEQDRDVVRLRKRLADRALELKLAHQRIAELEGRLRQRRATEGWRWTRPDRG